MYFVSFDMDGTERPCRAEVLARSATDAPLLVHGRDHQRFRVVRILAYKVDGTGRAVAGAVAAFHSVSVHYAVVEVYNCMSDLYR